MTHPPAPVALSWIEVCQAALAGVLRRMVALKKETPPRYGFDGKPWDTDIESCCAELLVAKTTGKYWIGALPHKDSGTDVGDYGVRSTVRDDGCLILHHGDADDQVFILVAGRVPRHKIVGAIRAGAGKREEFWKDDVREPAFFVPQSALDADELAAVLKGST